MPASATERFAPALAFANSLRATATVQHPYFGGAQGLGPVAPISGGRPAGTIDLERLIERLAGGKAGEGTCILVVETESDRDHLGLAAELARTLSPRARTLLVDVNGAVGGLTGPGLTDLVAGEAAFLDVIQPVRGSRLHRVRRGLVEREVLLEEPQALAIALNAMAQSYDWVLCRLDASGAEGSELLEACGPCADAIVIASNQAADDPALVTLYGLARETGAAQVLVAQDRQNAARPEADTKLEETPLRLSA